MEQDALNKITIYLKTGHLLKVVCKNYSFQFDDQMGEYIRYSFEGLMNPLEIGIVPAQIAGYIVEKVESVYPVYIRK